MFAVEGGVGEHGVLGGEPAPFDVLFLHPAGDAFLDHGGADDAGVAERDEHGAVGVWGDAGEEGDGAELVVVAAVGSVHGVVLDWIDGVVRR